MIVISTLAQKGGVGKTTLTLHWAVEVQRRTKKSVAVLDTDPQATAIEWRKLRTQPEPYVLDAFKQPLARVLQSCKDEGQDFVFIDSRPGVDSGIAEAARLSHLVVIPCTPTMPDMKGVGATVGIVREIGPHAVMVLNRARPGSGINDQAAHFLQSGYGLSVCPTYVMHRAALADAFSTGRAVSEVEPRGKAAMEIEQSWNWILRQVRKGK